MALLTAREVINWFLYGQATQPSNLVDDSLIRPAGQTATVTQDISEFMAGPGRFALGCKFQLITDFFRMRSSHRAPIQSKL
jgi:hypothetical protein